MLQHDEAESIPVFAWPTYSPDMSPIEHVWDALDRRIQQHVPVPVNIQQLRTTIEEEWTNILQATINNLINSMRRRCVALREANGVTPDTDWFSDTQYSQTVHFRHTCAIIMLSNQHLDMPHLWGGWIISAKEFFDNILDKYAFCVHRKSLRSLSSAHKKWGQRQKCCIYNFVQCMYVYVYIYMYICVYICIYIYMCVYVLELGGMTKNLYHVIFLNYTGFTVYDGIFFSHGWPGVNHIFYLLRKNCSRLT